MQTSLFLPVNRPLWSTMYHITKNGDNVCDALQLEAADVTPVVFRLITRSIPSLKSVNLSVPNLLRLYCWCLIRYAVTLTFALRPWTFPVSLLWRDQTLLPNFSEIEQ